MAVIADSGSVKYESNLPDVTIPETGPFNPVWVDCGDFRCLAYRNESGKWIAFGTGKEVTGVIRVYSSTEFEERERIA